jgi:AcrR family transcriptional regulator
MSTHVDSTDPGLRERKKLRTRARLIDAALELADRQGYENTTVEQIAEAVEVSPRTFARYFPTKDSAILALLGHLTSAVNAELALIPLEVPPFDALLAANTAMLRRAARGRAQLTAGRNITLMRIVNTSPTLQTLAIDMRARETADALTKRLGDAYDDRTILLISAVWSAIVSSAWGALGTDRQPLAPTTDLPALMHRMMDATFADFAEVSSGLEVNSAGLFRQVHDHREGTRPDM